MIGLIVAAPTAIEADAMAVCQAAAAYDCTVVAREEFGPGWGRWRWWGSKGWHAQAPRWLAQAPRWQKQALRRGGP